ncbi:MAG: ATP-binding protein [Acidimicrobiia bacterium]
MERDVAITELEHSASAPREARRFAAATLDAWGLADLADDVTLLVSELVSNVVHHTDGGAVLRLSRTPQRLRCSVIDGGGHAPHRRAPAPTDPSGRGLLLVDALSISWGSTTTRGRTEVWFEVSIRDS